MDETDEADEPGLECIGRRNRNACSDIAYPLARRRYSRNTESQSCFILIFYKLFPKAELLKIHTEPYRLAQCRRSRLAYVELLLGLVSFFGGFYSPLTVILILTSFFTDTNTYNIQVWILL